ncbi:MAG: ribose-phosphate pyrophosphokinase [Clostridia bacterium]|nr:ribose-phosphate pyrophosphokinase [Clostridia bacterium]
MTDFTSNWNDESILTSPYAPLGLIAMPGFEEFGRKVNDWLMKWRENQESLDETPLNSVLGYNRDNFLIDVECPHFGNGEAKGLIKSSVRGYDLYILSDIGAYNLEYEMYGRKVPMSPDDHFQNLKRIIAATGGRSSRINLIMPMLYEGRQHRRTARESLDCALALQDLERMGVKNIITFDAHDPRVQNAVPMIPLDSVRPSYQILKALLRSEKDLQIDEDHLMIVSPDEGAMDRNIYYASMLELKLGVFYKRRDYTRIKEGSNPIIAHEYLGDSVEGKDIFVSDDILASGSSLLDLAEQLKERKARRIYCSVTFPLFTHGIEKFDKAYEEGLITKVISTNLTYTRPEVLNAPWFVQADMSKYVSYFIASLNHDRSISSLLDPSRRIHKLVARYKQEQIDNGIQF